MEKIDKAISEMFSVAISSPENEQFARSSILNMTFSGKALGYKGRKKITLALKLNEIQLAVAEGNPILTTQISVFSASLDLLTFRTMPVGIYKVTVTATLDKAFGKEESLPDDLVATASSVFFYIPDEVQERQHLLQRQQQQQQQYPVIQKGSHEVQPSSTQRTQAQSDDISQQRQHLKQNNAFARETLPDHVKIFQREEETGLIFRHFLDESGQSGRNFIYFVDSINDRLVQSNLDRDIKSVRIVNPPQGSTMSSKAADISVEIPVKHLRSQSLIVLADIDGSEYDITSHVRQQLPQYDALMEVSTSEETIDKFTFHVKGLDAGEHFVTLKIRDSSTQEIDAIVGRDRVGFIIMD